MSTGRYANNTKWADVIPLPQEDGGPNALSTIAYTDEYKEAMSYLRAVMAKNEFSERVLELTHHIIKLNPAHYTVWLYRAKTLEALGADLSKEIAWLNVISLQHIKNYQIWHHRQLLMQRLNDPSGEFEFLAEMLAKDVKNYHVWSYRQWLVRQFDLWDTNELEEVERFLKLDIRNNSAWNHRWFVVFGREQVGHIVPDEDVQREFEFAKAAIEIAPQNESPWNYLRGLLRRSKRSYTELEEFASRFAPLNGSGIVRSSHALNFLAEAAAEKKDLQQAEHCLDLLARKYDPIRVNYWNYRKSRLNSSA